MRKSIWSLVVPGMLVGVLGLNGAAEAAAGHTAGSFAVSSSGAATYKIPIWTPPGPKGIQPNIALVYNSQAGNGYVGVGWGLSGLSAITRCNLTYAQDGAPASVSLAASDRYCLDGQRLRLTSGTYGAAGSTYQTEIANFENVTAYGTAGNGPSYFVVQTRDGHTLQYGYGSGQILASGTTTALAWMLDEVSDPPGNTMTISYTLAMGTAVPATISWTPTSHGASAYSYTMQFSYGTNVLPPAGYVAGTPVQNPNLLGSITINYAGSQVKQYILTYQLSGTTGRDRLYQVQECAASTSNCLNPTMISYQNGVVGVSTTPTTAISSPLPATFPAFSSKYDFNGDGYTDLLYQVGSTWYVAFGSASGYGTPVNTGITGGALATNILVGDLLGSGNAGILANHSGTWYYYAWNGSSFVSLSTGLAFDTAASQFALADINGDGLPDLVDLHAVGAVITTRLNTSSGATPSFSSSAVTAYAASVVSSSLITPDSQGGNLKYFDFNGDGRQDLAISVVYCTLYWGPTCIEYGEGIAMLVAQSGGTFSASSGTPTGTLTFANINNDACTDIILNQQLALASPCNGSGWINLGATYPVVAVMDWNGDGLADLIEASGGTLYVQLSTGTGFGAAMALSVPYAANCTYVTLEANGDGLDELGCLSTTAGTNGFTYYLHNGAGTPPDLLTSVTDANGNSASPAYGSIVQSHYVAGAGTYPDVPYLAPIYVADTVTYSDPSSSGGTYSQTFEYYDSHQNLQGRGWDGFAQMRTLDSRNGLYDNRYFLTSFPYTGMQYEDLRSNGTISLSESLGTQAVTTLSSTSYEQRYFPYFSNVTRQRWELGGPENGDLVTTVSTNYTYDIYGNATTVAATTTDNDPGSAYHGDTWTTTTTNTTDPSPYTWCLNLFTQTQVAYTASIGGSITRTRQFTPDLTNCRYTQVVTEPSSGTYKVTESLGYDAFGNLNSDAVTGIGMAARTATASWGTTGQFPMSVTDPTGALTQFNYNFSYGLPSSVTDPNGLTTTETYGDGFGRKTQENRPDGTYTTYSYTDCASSGCLIGGHGLVVNDAVHNVDTSIQSSGTNYSDMVDRPLVQMSPMLSSTAAARNEVRYDSLGRIVERAAACTWTSITTPCSYWSTSSFDVLNRVTQVQRPISSTDSTLQTTVYQYAGRTTTVTDPQSNTATTVKDVNGWLRQTKDAVGYVVTLGYDAVGSETSVTDSLGNALWSGTYGYGTGAFLTSATDMDLGAWTYGVDALGEQTSWQDAKGQSFSETYDALSRPLTRTEPDLFTRWTWGSSATSHNIGQLQSVCTGTGTTCTSAGYAETDSYDSVGRPYQRAITMPVAVTYTYTRLYNSNTGLLDTLTYPASTSGYSLQLQYGYLNGLLQSVKDISDTPNVALWTGNAADPAGQVTQETLGNGIVTNRAFDAVTGWLGSIQSGVGGGAGVQNQSFLYDEMGNVIQRQDNNQGLTENSFYDADYRLQTTKLNGTQNLSVSYDDTGNITSRSDVAAGATWTYDPVRKHAVTQAGSAGYSYAYDANGNATSRMGSTISWSSYNYPTTISAGSGSTAESVSFAYGPDRSRWQQSYTGNGTTETTDYIGGLLDVVSSGGVTDYRHYIYAGSEPIAVYSRKSTGVNTFSYLLSDHQGSIADITSASGTVDVPESFTPFGNRRNPATWSGAASNSDLTNAAGITRQGYTFQTQLGLWMGLNHMNGRVQDTVTGRFLSADPNIPDPTNAQDYNRYAYVRNNPLSLVDPSGFDDSNSDDSNLAEVTVTGCRNPNSIWLPNYGCFAITIDWGFSIQQYLQWTGTLLGGYRSSPGLSTGGNGGNTSTPPPPPPPPPTPPLTTPQTTQPDPCAGSGTAGQIAAGLDTASTWAGRVALVSGVAALATSETGVGAAVFGAVAGIAEATSYVLGGASAAINYVNGNSRGALATVLGTVVGAALPRGLGMSVPGLTGSSRAVGALVAGTEGDVAATLTQAVTCHYQ